MAILNSTTHKRQINLSGSDGNAFVLLGQARSFAKQLKYSEAETAALMADMKSSDYENLITVFDKHFGNFVDLIR